MEIQIAKLPRIQIRKDKFNKLPENCGVYIFWAKNEAPLADASGIFSARFVGAKSAEAENSSHSSTSLRSWFSAKADKAIYIGKAVNLKNRLLSYLQINLAPKTKSMISEACDVSFIKVNSELESLLLEAHLVRKNQPKYNATLKDDKHPLYIIITNEYYPRILCVRKLDAKNYQPKAIFGPFPNSKNVYSVLKMLRRIFPFSDHKLGRRGCLYNHIGLCNPCPNEIEKIKDEKLKIKLKGKYLKNIRNIKLILSRNIHSVRRSLEKEMRQFSKEEKFEEAFFVKKQIENIDYITQPILPTHYFVENPNLYEDLRAQELSELKKILNSYFIIHNSLTRIECFDVAHLAGTNPTASMVTFINGEADKRLYRHFRIRNRKGNDDIASLSEVARRRLRHLSDWGKPDLIIVDGGVGQVHAFTSILYSNKVDIPVVGIAKNPDRLIVGGKKIRLTGSVLNLVARIRNEAHRFARAYHHKLVKKSLLQ